MQKNYLYKNDLTTANAEITQLDQGDSNNWFYHKSGLDEPLEDAELRAKEDMISGVLEKVRSNYRKRHEKMKMPFPAARPFPEQKERIQNCPAFQILQKMPKCGLLHVHNVAALSPDGFLDLLKSWCSKYREEKSSQDHPLIYILTQKDPNRRDLPLGSLLFATKGIQKECLEALDTFLLYPANEDWLRSLLSFRSVPKTDRVSYIWDEFNKMFLRTSDLFNLELFYYEFHVAAFQEMIRNKIDYVELRSSLSNFSALETDGSDGSAKWALPTFSLEPWELKKTSQVPFLDLMLQALAESNRNFPDTPLELRVILAARRDLDPSPRAPGSRAKLLKKLDSAILIRQMDRYYSLVIGFDFVSEEDRGQETKQYIQEIIYGDWGAGYDETGSGLIEKFRNENKTAEHPFMIYSPRIQLIDFYLHDGESLWASNQNMSSAVVASRLRIGHGFLMAKYPYLMGQVTAPGDPTSDSSFPHEPVLEICPISNQMLRYYPDLRAHSAYDLMKAGVQCVLGTDDPLLLNNADPTFDYWEAFIGMGLPFYAIKGLLFNSYYYHCLQTEPEGALKELTITFHKRYWLPFVEAAHTLIKDMKWDTVLP